MEFFVWQRTCVDDAGNVLASASVTVTDVVSGSLAQPYSDEGSTAIGNPITAGDDGFVQFFVKAGLYNITATSGGSSRTWTKEAIGAPHKRTPAEIAAGVTAVDYRYPELNVLRYGTNTTPGTTLMTTAWQNAIDVAGQKDQGGTVYGPEGLYLVGQLQMKYKVSLLGACSQSFFAATATQIGTVLKLADNTDAPMIVNDQTTGDALGTGIDGGTRRFAYSSVENILFDGNRDNQTSLDADIFRLTNCWAFAIRKCGLYSAKGFGIRALDCNVLEIINNSLIRAAVYWEHVADSLFAHNQIGANLAPIYPLLWITGRGGSGPGAFQNVISDNFIYNNANNEEISQPTFTVDTGTDVITTSAAHGWADGTPVVVTTTGSAPGGVTVGKTYYWKSITSTTGKLATSRANLAAETYVDITSAGSGTHTIGVGENAGLYLNDGAKWNAINSNRIDQNYGHGILMRDAHDNPVSGNLINSSGLGNLAGQAGVKLVASTGNVFAGNVVDGTELTGPNESTSNQSVGFDGDSNSTDNVGALASQSFNHSTANVDMDAGYKIDEAQETIFLPPQRFSAASGTSPSLGSVGTNRRSAFFMDGAGADEIIDAWVRVPPHWAGFTAEILWVNAGAGSGDVAWSVSGGEFVDGENVNVADAQTSALTADTAGARDIIVTTAPAEEFTCTAGEYFNLRVKRTSSDSGDTLANDVGLIGLRLTRA